MKPCENCGQPTTGILCDPCGNEVEAGYERWHEDFYGGAAPMTDRERAEVAERQHFHVPKRESE